MGLSVEFIKGTLIDDAGNALPVNLRLVVKTFADSDERSVSDCKLISNGIPDGIYTLEYTYFQHHSSQIRIQSGALVTTQIG